MALWKSPLRFRKIQQASDAHCTGGFAENSDIVRITAKRRDIVSHPAQRGDLVLKPFISGGRYFALGQLLQIQKAQSSQPIIDRDKHDVAVCGQRARAVHSAWNRIPCRKHRRGSRPSRDVAHHPGPGEKTFRNRQSSLCGSGFSAKPGRRHRILRCNRSIFFCRSHALPGFERLRRQPSQFSHRRSGVRHSFKCIEILSRKHLPARRIVVSTISLLWLLIRHYSSAISAVNQSSASVSPNAAFRARQGALRECGQLAAASNMQPNEACFSNVPLKARSKLPHSNQAAPRRTYGHL